MNKKVLLILVDGMRPDAIMQCGNPKLLEFYKKGTYCLGASTVYPPVTLPVHMSLFHSVDPDRHGVTGNVFVKQNHPIEGLIEKLALAKKRTAFFYMWEELRDLCTAGNHLSFSWYMSWHYYEAKKLDWRVTKECERHIEECEPDFAFLYLGETDEIGHRYGWMSPEYLQAVSTAGDCIDEISKLVGDRYEIIVTADHGGHGRNHGENIPEDMIIPITFVGTRFTPGKELSQLNVKDIAPTILSIFDIEQDPQWDGRSILDD